MKYIFYKIKNKSRIFDEKYEGYFLTVLCGLVVGIFWISFILWNRLIREHLPRDLTLVEPYSITFWVVLFLYLGAIVIIKMYFWVKAWRGITKTNKYLIKFCEWLLKNPKLVNISQFITNYILKAPFYVWRYLYFPYEKYKYKFVINPIYSFGVVLADDVYKKSKLQSNSILSTIIILSYLPRILASSVFLYEILIFKKLDYFYTFAIILLHPLIFLSLRRMLFDIAYRERKIIMEELLTIKIVEDSCGLFGPNIHQKILQ
jgi:hypothetical protein